jgi:dienelactone hydrolase
MKIAYQIATTLGRMPRYGAAGLVALAVAGLSSCSTDVPPSMTGQGVVAQFNPSASPPLVPSVTDLVLVGGQLQIPTDPAEASNGALATFNNYLRGLDGFPPDSTVSTTFSGAVDSTSLTEGVVVYDATTQMLLTAPAVTPTLDATNTQLVLGNQSRWRNGHTYVVALLSWQQSTDVHGLHSPDGKNVLADTAFAFLRSQTPLYAKCQDATNAACACADLTDSACHAVVDGLSDSQAQQLEAARLRLKPLIDSMLTATGRLRSDLVLAFSFTISQRSFATFDLARSQAPFPSNLLLANHGVGDPLADSNVSLPILPTDDARTQALKGGLNTLDGFSTTGSVQFPVDSAVSGATPVDIDATTVLPGKTAFLINLLSPTQQPTFTAQPLHALIDANATVNGFAGQIWITPSRPLSSDRATYAAVLTTAIKDANGQNLLQSPTTLLLTQSSSLLTADGKSAVPALSLAQAQQLEPLRQALAPLVSQLAALGIKPGSIAALTAYRTQSVLKPLQQLTAGMTALAPAIPSTATLGTVQTALPATLGNLSAVVHGTLSVLRVLDLRGPFNLSRLAPTTTKDVIPFMMTLPAKGLAPASGAPVVIAQHGLGRWRGDTLAIANSLGGQGLAMIAIDVIYHGGRVVCLSKADCASGVACNQPAPVNGVPQAGTCAGGAYLPASGATPTLPGSTALIPNGNLPSRDFTNLANPFAQRDNFRQHMLDLNQLVRVIKDTTAGGLAAQLATNPMLPTLDQGKLGYVGQSLGAILGTNFLAMSPDVSLGVINVGGGDVVDIFSDPGSMLSTGLAAELGVTANTPAWFSLLENFRWIMDPADPINLARYVRNPDPTQMPGRTKARVILQEAGMDTVVLNKYTLMLGRELGLPLDANLHLQGINQEGGAAPSNVSTFFPAADHGVLLDFVNAALTAQVQAQAAVYLATGMGGQPPTVQ